MVWTWLEPMCHKECQEIFRKYVAKSVRLRKRIALACCSPLRKLTVSSMMEIAKSPEGEKCHRPLPYQLLSVKVLSRKDGQINRGIKKDEKRWKKHIFFRKKYYWFLPVWLFFSTTGPGRRSEGRAAHCVCDAVQHFGFVSHGDYTTYAAVKCFWMVC